MMRRRIPLVPAACLLAAVLLTGCGQSARDRYLESRASVHRPVTVDAAGAGPVASVPAEPD